MNSFKEKISLQKVRLIWTEVSESVEFYEKHRVLRIICRGDEEIFDFRENIYLSLEHFYDISPIEVWFGR